MREWRADVAVDEALVRLLLASRFPELPLRDVRPLAEGWDNSIWLVNGAWAFRFPRRAIAVPGVERELALLPRLAPLLPLPIPVPALVGRPARDYPWPFFGAAFLPGQEISALPPGDVTRDRLAAALGGFLRVLHGREVAATASGTLALPEDPFGRADMALRVPRTLERLEEIGRLGLWRAPAGVRALLAEALDLPPPAPVAVVHGDLHFRHVLVDADGRLAGVVDWGDLCLADPAVDLQLGWSLFSPAGREAFLAAYGPVEEAQLVRARVLALFLGAALALYARAEGLERVEREAVAALARTASG